MGTPIQGKIFPMYNKETGANRERRFPITVMEAVLGLPSYLQNQFSALADIYMPIEGISEAFTGQEFVYRKSPNTIKAKSLTLDRIKGKSLVWNQLAIAAGADFRYDRDTERVRMINIGLVPSGHKVLLAFVIKNAVQSTSDVNYFGIEFGPQSFVPIEDGRVAIIVTFDSDRTSIYTFINMACSSGTAFTMQGFVAIDLTLMFGAGNEPTTVAEFYALLPLIPSAYTPGTLISNDAEAVETTGVNQWDEEWEEGSIDSLGQNTPSSTTIRSKNLIPIIPNTEYYNRRADITQGHYFYDANGDFIRRDGVNTYIFTTPQNAAYMRFVQSDTSYNSETCINISNPAINGQYFPYWKRDLQLGLNSFKVKDGNGNIITITGGLKSAGSVYDEIVGNKYIKRVGSVDLGTLTWYTYTNSGEKMSFWANLADAKINAVTNIFSERHIGALEGNVYGSGQLDKTICIHSGLARIYVADLTYSTAEAFKTAMNGVIANYELATPIEYDLVEPLIYTTKAGTTEERISPNSDGLSAPFCCDMTYSANENNDAGNAQYAATAGRLLNTRKIWGQDFNGSDNISGALEGVTTISASGLATLGGGLIIPNTADAKHGTLDFIDGDRVKHISVVTLEEYPASPDLNTLYIIYQD